MRELELNAEQQELFDANTALVLYTYLNYYISKAISYQIDQEDLMQVGYMGLAKAAKTFNQERGCNFSTYAVTCVKNAMSLVIKNARRKHHDSNISLYTPIANQGDDIITLADEIPDNSMPLDELMILRETIDRLDRLKPRPLSVVKMRAEGNTYEYIGNKLNITREGVRGIILDVRKYLETDERDLSKRKNAIYYN